MASSSGYIGGGFCRFDEGAKKSVSNGKTRSCVVCLFIESATPRFVFFFSDELHAIDPFGMLPKRFSRVGQWTIKIPFFKYESVMIWLIANGGGGYTWVYLVYLGCFYFHST